MTSRLLLALACFACTATHACNGDVGQPAEDGGSVPDGAPAADGSVTPTPDGAGPAPDAQPSGDAAAPPPDAPPDAPPPGEASCDGLGGERTGEATYYDFADGSGNCSFDPSPGDLMIGAMNHTDYASSAACGACVELTGPDGTITVRIVDRCPECPEGDIDLSPEAFQRIAALERGRVPISWHYVPCSPAGPVRYHFKDGSNPYWTAVQIRDHTHAIARFEYLDADGAFREVERLEYNYFVEPAGMGEGPYTFRITDVLGQVLEDSGIPLVPEQSVDGQAQFPACR